MTQASNPVGLYLGKIQQELSTGHAQEHSYRPALKELFETVTGLRVVNEPKGSAHGRPDFIFVRGDVPIAWAEAKDLHVSLEKIEKSEQMERYFGYPTLILTNGLEFRFYQNGQRYGDAFVLAEKDGSTVISKPEVFDAFVRTLADFMTGEIDTIRSAEHLAKIMGGKAKRLRDNIIAMFDSSFTGSRGEIEKIMQVLKQRLLHDLSIDQFADLYAQTLVYGLFVARYHDESPESFSRTEARERIPASNHLLQQFFDHIAGANFEKRLSFIVDELCDVFIHADVHALVHGLYLKKNDTHDPIIHFYEDFLREYDPKLRMERGVFYTPLPVVRYIVRSVDALLKEHFGLPEGLADRAKVDFERMVQGKKSKTQIDRVQVLDPAVGTGTFLNEVIRNIHEKFEGQQGMWPQYVEDHLIPRLHGFELMMASYTIAHLKLSMTLAESGVKETKKRLRVFLTNSLEEPADTDINLFNFGLQEALTEEAQAAAEVKRDYPIMVVLGNPPYSVSSQNASIEVGPDGKKRKTWIGKLLDDYKKDLNEKKLNLDDDYIKFIRFAHHLIEKNGQGIVAMITNNSFLDGITHRRMRQSHEMSTLPPNFDNEKPSIAASMVRNPPPWMLTKSDYLRFLECPIHLWLHKHRSHEVGHHIDPNLQWIFEQGDMVEAHARSLFSDAQMVVGHSHKSEEQTKALIDAGVTELFQATAIADGQMTMADIFVLNPKTHEWDIYEVKSTTDVEDKHLHDVCFQMITFKKAGYAIGKLHLIHVNPEYVRRGEIDARSFLVVEDITEQAYALEAEVIAGIAAAKHVAECADTPSCDGCTCSPKECPCHQYCYPNLPEYSVFQLYRVKVKQARDLYRKGIRNLLDLPHDFKLTKAQQLQLEVARTGKPVIDTSSIQAVINTATYPIAFLDYETFFPAVPLFDGYKPYQQMVFQYSLHVLSEDGTLQHSECLVRSLQDPVPEILRTLRAELPDTGTIVVWNKGFEMGRNEEMAALLPDYAVFLQSLNSRVFDLMDVFRKQHYVHPDFRGSCSIKKVLPVLVPALSYKDLVIQEGGTASLTWYRALTDGRNEEERVKTFEHMLAYCKLDTLAMVEVFRHLKTFTAS